MRKLIALGILAGVVWVAAVIAMPADGKPRGQNGRIAFALFDPALDGPVTYTANPDGSHVEQLFSAGPSGEPRWSPDGSQIAILAPCTDGEENCGVTLVNPDTGDFRQHKMPDPNLFTACIVWSPDGKRLACEGFGEPDPTASPSACTSSRPTAADCDGSRLRGRSSPCPPWVTGRRRAIRSCSAAA
jgi:hypothetical protein